MDETQTPTPEDQMADTPIRAFKGFDADLKCRDYQFAVGETYEHIGKVEACASGFHACLNPFDVWNYYDLTDSRFCEVTLSGDTDKDGSDSKIAAGRITIEAEFKLPDFIRRAVDWLIKDTKGKAEDETGDYAQIGSSGDYAKIGSSGHSAQIGSSGHSAQIGSSGDYAKIGSSGDYAQIGSSGHYAQIGSSGHYAQIGSSGDYAQIGSSGHYAQIGSSGHYAQIGSSGDSAQIGSSGHSAKIGSSGHSAKIGSSGHYAKIGSSGHYAKIGSSGHSAKIKTTGKKAVVASAGVNTKAKGADGTWISLAEFDRDGNCIGFATGCIGQDGLKADTWLKAKGGKLVETGQ